MENEFYSDIAFCKNCKFWDSSDGLCKISDSPHLWTKIGENGTCANFIETLEEDKERDLQIFLQINHKKIKEILKKYMDLEEEYYNLISLWIIGSYFHKSFSTYPYLFFNAMKGSGKTRLLKLIAALSYNGKLLVSMSEAVLFRTASQRTFCIDEMEHIASKEKGTLRELLNAAYKKGMSVERAYQIETRTEEGRKKEVKIESFDVFCPIAMANIWGMEEVLADRCVSLILEKSNNKRITRLIESYDTDTDIESVLRALSSVVMQFSVVSVVKKNIYRWNTFVHSFNDNITTLTTLTTPTTQTTETTLTTQVNDNITTLTTLTTQTTETTLTTQLLEKVRKTTLEGRPLELFFPLFIIADFCGVLDETIETAEKIVKERKEEDIVESRDVAFLSFIAETVKTDEFVSVSNLAKDFRLEEDEEWINSKWVGRALKRLGIMIEKKRIARGMEVRINFEKAKKRILIFKPQEKQVEEPNHQEQLTITEEIPHEKIGEEKAT